MRGFGERLRGWVGGANRANSDPSAKLMGALEAPSLELTAEPAPSADATADPQQICTRSQGLPDKAKSLKAPHTRQEAAKRFLAYMLATGQTGPLRSGSVYGTYVEWAIEEEGRQPLADNTFLPALEALGGVRKVQTSYPHPRRPEKPIRSYRWWFEEIEPKKARKPKAAPKHPSADVISLTDAASERMQAKVKRSQARARKQQPRAVRRMAA